MRLLLVVLFTLLAGLAAAVPSCFNEEDFQTTPTVRAARVAVWNCSPDPVQIMAARLDTPTTPVDTAVVAAGTGRVFALVMDPPVDHVVTLTFQDGSRVRRIVRPYTDTNRPVTPGMEYIARAVDAIGAKEFTALFRAELDSAAGLNENKKDLWTLVVDLQARNSGTAFARWASGLVSTRRATVTPAVTLTLTPADVGTFRAALKAAAGRTLRAERDKLGTLVGTSPDLD